MALTYDCYVRIYVKCDEDGRIIEDYNDTTDTLCGHYDLQINKPSGDTLKLPYNKTVFSYGYRKTTAGKQQGTLKIFNANNTEKVFKSFTYRLYYWHFQATEAQVTNFKSVLSNGIAEGEKKTYYTVYDVTHKDFKEYIFEKVNCFYATASWVACLGNNKLMTTYNDYKDWDKGYRNYFAWRMWLKYHQYWTGGTLYNA